MNIARIVFISIAVVVVIISTSCNADINITHPVKGTFKWVQTWGGLAACTARENAHDSKKNVYIGGYFQGTVDFNPDPDITEEFTSMGANDCYLIKFDKEGIFQWVRVWGGVENENIYDIFVDKNDNVIVGGFFGTYVKINPIPGYKVDFNPSDTKTLELICNGSRDCFVSSFSSDGSLRWATSWGGLRRDEVEALTADSKRNIYVGGIYEDTCDFNPDPVDINEFTAIYSNDIFLSKFDSNGNYEETQVWGGTNFEAVQTLNVDDDNNIYIGGVYRETVDFDPDEIKIDEHTATLNTENKTTYDCWFSKFNSKMEYQWVRAWGGEKSDWVYSIAVDSKSNIYVSGYFNAVVDFDPDEVNVVNQTSNGASDAYLSKFDKDGMFVWVQTWGAEEDDKSGTVYLDGVDNIYVSREFGGNTTTAGYEVDFNPSFLEDKRQTNGKQDCYFSKFDSDGNFIWTKAWGGAGQDYVYSMTVTTDGIVYITGVFQETVDFNPEDDLDPITTTDVEERTSQGSFDSFMIVFE